MRQAFLSCLQVLLTAGLLAAAAAWAISNSARAHGDDLMQDYLSARAWLHGLDPHQELSNLYAHFGYVEPQRDTPIPYNPHPPLAVALLLPFAWLPFEEALRAYQSAQIVAFSLAWNWAGWTFGRTRWGWALLGGGWGMWSPVWQGLDWGQGNGFIALALMAVWAALRQGQPWVVGVALGLACSLRPFLAFAGTPLLRWPVRRLAVTVAVAAAAAGIAFLLMRDTPWDWLGRGVSVEGYIQECTTLPRLLGLNLAGSVVLMLAAAALLVVLSRRGGSDDQLLALGVAVMSLVYPLLWFYYDSVLIPVVAWLITHPGVRRGRWAFVLAALFIALRGIPALQAPGQTQVVLILLGRSCLLGSVLLAEVQKQPEPSEPAPET